MELLDKRELLADVANRWDNQYPPKHPDHSSPAQLEIGRKLHTLGASASAKAINDIIGNDTWTRFDTCQECNRREGVVRVGEEPDYESATVYLCKPCVRKLAALVLGK